MKEFCSHSTKVECMKFNESQDPCEKLHFAKILQPHTDESLGDCSFLNTCFHMDTCKYIHYEVDAEDIRKQRWSSSHVYTNFESTIFFAFFLYLRIGSFLLISKLKEKYAGSANCQYKRLFTPKKKIM